MTAEARQIEGARPEPHVFVSYSSKDRTVADAVLKALESAGVPCWIAPRDIRPGRDWGESIVEAIEGSRAMVLVFSGNANASPQVRREVERAVNERVVIVPFRIEDVPPCKSLEYVIRVGHWLDACSTPLEPHLATLVATVTALARDGEVGASQDGTGKGGTSSATGAALTALTASTTSSAEEARLAVAARRQRAMAAATAAAADERRGGPGRPRRTRPAALGVAVLGAAGVGCFVLGGNRWPWPARVSAALDVAPPPADPPAFPENPDARRPPPLSFPPVGPTNPTSVGWLPPVRPSAPPLRPVGGRTGGIVRSAGSADVAAMHLTSVAQVGAHRFCVIDGVTLREGEAARGGYVVRQIESDRVTLTRDGRRFDLRPQPKPPVEPGGLPPPEVLFGRRPPGR